MPATSRRRTRRREPEEIANAIDTPTRPASKRRKTSARNTSSQSPSIAAADVSAHTVDTESSAEYNIEDPLSVANFVVANLSEAKEPVNAASHYANETTGSKGVEAYAKISARDWTYYIKSLHVTIGRPAEPRHMSEYTLPSSPPLLYEDDKNGHLAEQKIHIDLGPSKHISRLHAEILYDMDRSNHWKLVINGRNGARVNESKYMRRGQSVTLHSGDVIDIAGTEMLFVLPNEPITIDPMVLKAAERRSKGEDFDDGVDAHAHSGDRRSPSAAMSQEAGLEHAAFSTPNDSRHVTPPPISSAMPSSSRVKPSPAYTRGVMIKTTEEIDYSADSAKDLKPPHSYAVMIADAILSSPGEAIALNKIYDFIMKKYAFYRYNKSGWQNSIRHNLSLNKAFEKIPRKTNEPGKGMKWRIVKEQHDEYAKKVAEKKGLTVSSSVPTSPAIQQTPIKMEPAALPSPMVAPPATHADIFTSAPQNPRHRSTTPTYSIRPPLTYTPSRPTPNLAPTTASRLPHLDDSSPLPRAYNPSASVNSPPTLSSSYFDENPSATLLITPAPQRSHPKLNPPSTARLPSKYIPTSSPAPFWKFLAEELNSPAKGFDVSPDKERLVMSSSPPPMESGSPSKPARRSVRRDHEDTLEEEDEEEEEDEMEEGHLGVEAEEHEEHDDDDDNEDDDGEGEGEGEVDVGFGGIDLAKGFESISAFHNKRMVGETSKSRLP